MQQQSGMRMPDPSAPRQGVNPGQPMGGMQGGPAQQQRPPQMGPGGPGGAQGMQQQQQWQQQQPNMNMNMAGGVGGVPRPGMGRGGAVGGMQGGGAGGPGMPGGNQVPERRTMQSLQQLIQV